MLHTQDPAMQSPAVETAPHEADDFAAILIEQTDRLLSREMTPACLKAADEGAFPTAAWQAVCEAGLPYAMVAEEEGGAGLDATAAANILRRAGFHALPAPLGEDMVARALWSAAGGAPVDGMIALAGTAWPVPAEVATGSPDAGLPGDTLSEIRFPNVPWGKLAAHVLVAVPGADGARGLMLLPSRAFEGWGRRNLAGEPRDTLSITADAMALHPVLPWPAALACAEDLFVYGAFVRAQQMAGAMERCLGLSVAYANERRQFGKPIGRFQAVQHMLAVAAGESAAAAAASEIAAAAWGTQHFALAVAIAKARCGEAAGKVAEVCHQVHGAMGFTREHALHLFTRRLWAWRDEYGNDAHWQERIGRTVCAQGGEALWPMLVALRAAGACGREGRA